MKEPFAAPVAVKELLLKAGAPTGWSCKVLFKTASWYPDTEDSKVAKLVNEEAETRV